MKKITGMAWEICDANVMCVLVSFHCIVLYINTTDGGVI